LCREAANFRRTRPGLSQIFGVKYKQIGVLKNGETGEYDIPCESVYIFAGPIQTEGRYAYHEIPAGDRDVKLFTAPGKTVFGIYTEKRFTELGETKGG
jgi:hypothetical protein